MPISDQLRQAIREHGGSVYVIAKGAGVAQPVVSRFLKGERDIRLETADRLAAFLGLELCATAKAKTTRPARRGQGGGTRSGPQAGSQ